MVWPIMVRFGDNYLQPDSSIVQATLESTTIEARNAQ